MINFIFFSKIIFLFFRNMNKIAKRAAWEKYDSDFGTFICKYI